MVRPMMPMKRANKNIHKPINYDYVNPAKIFNRTGGIAKALIISIFMLLVGLIFPFLKLLFWAGLFLLVFFIIFLVVAALMKA